MTHPPLSPAVVACLGTLVRWRNTNAKVWWLPEPGDKVREGILRAFVVSEDDMGFPNWDTRDIRDVSLWFTMRSGFEYVMPVSEAVGLLGRAHMGEDWPSR